MHLDHATSPGDDSPPNDSPPDGSPEGTPPAGRWIVAATVLGSGAVFLESTVVNVALPAIGRDLGLGVEGLQWVVNAFLLTLSALILLGGALGDRYSRRKVFV